MLIICTSFVALLSIWILAFLLPLPLCFCLAVCHEILQISNLLLDSINLWKQCSIRFSLNSLAAPVCACSSNWSSSSTGALVCSNKSVKTITATVLNRRLTSISSDHMNLTLICKCYVCKTAVSNENICQVQTVDQISSSRIISLRMINKSGYRERHPFSLTVG